MQQPDDDGRTSVKVAVRVRPVPETADPAFDSIPHRFRGSTCSVSGPTNLTVESAQGKKLFVFDRVFPQSDKQQDVWEYVSDGVNAFIKGYNVSIMAYGQSGAGKSYTMGTTSPGEQMASTEQGIIPRATAALFQRLSPPPTSTPVAATSPNSRGSGIRPPSRYTPSLTSNASSLGGGADDRSWQLKATYVEIYNEQLRDLLLPESIPVNERSAVAIREDPKGRIILTGLHQVSINSVEDLMQALNFGSSIRQTDATMVNSKSSRSHAVFSLNLIQRKQKINGSGSLISENNSNNVRSGVPQFDASMADSVLTVDSKLHFVDLAGSERLKNTGLKGERVKEGISINAGLAALGKVISQLSSKHGGTHVSYRDSKLTRLLQDSLGGNAITYMVACINPVEFHLSETLNTVQYAQRARAIQSKPQIQHRVEEGDKHVIIERLRAEVAFLREQIRNTQRAERRSTSAHDRPGRKHDRENELQDQLLDVQENYSALSQRHAKLIAELAKDKGQDVEQLPALKGALQNASLDRLHRSSSFADDVEHVVLEYEKTIHSLETALSNARASLATSEGSLLEREAKIVYMDAVTQQLQARIQKALDRETTSENYVRQLESKLDGVSNGDEGSLVIIQDLRKELARIRESESSAEDYISTLEERLAEAEQETDLMQREINRLENVVERQRSIGKLDNLLSEMDTIQHQKKPPVSNGNASKKYSDDISNNNINTDAFHDRLVATAGFTHPSDEVLPEDAEAEWKSFGPMEGADDDDDNVKGHDDDDEGRNSHFTVTNTRTIDSASQSEYSEALQQQQQQQQQQQPSLIPSRLANKSKSSVNGDHSPETAAQVKALADKLETTTLELFDLRVDHETTVAELEDTSQKYRDALNILSELQEAVDGHREARSSHTETNGSSISGPATVNGTIGHEQRFSGRMITSDASSIGDSPTLVDPSDANHSTYSGRPESKLTTRGQSNREETLADSVRALKRANAEKDIDISTLTENYAQLQDQHQDSLNYIEELKEEMQRAQAHANALTPDRRKSAMGKEREARAFSTLRSIGATHVTKSPKDMKNFETNLTALFTDSRLRSDRIATLEAEVAAARRELSVKNSMITGLAKERSSQSSSVPLDVSLIAPMRQHLQESSRQITAFHESSASQDEALSDKIIVLMRDLSQGIMKPRDTDGTSEADNQSKTLDFLETAITNFVVDHQAHLQATQDMEQDLLKTIERLESSLRNAENIHNEKVAAKALRNEMRPESTNSDFEAEKARHLEQVTALQREIDGYKATADSHAAKLLHLENSYSQIIQEVEEDAKNRDITESELQTHRELVTNLEAQIDQQKSLATFHQQGLKSLQDSHDKEIEELQKTIKIEQRAAADQYKQYNESSSALREELTRAHMEVAHLMESVSLAFNEDIEPAALQSRMQAMVEEQKSISSKHVAVSEALEAAQKQVLGSKRMTVSLENKVSELTSLNEETLKELEKSMVKEQRMSKMAKDYEEQLKQHQRASQTVNTTQNEERTALEAELEEYKNKVHNLEVQLSETRTDGERRPSNASMLKHSNSAASLPSPPPAVPLPPLPHAPAMEGAASPPSSRHTSRDVASVAAAATRDSAQAHELEDLQGRLRTIEKNLFAERQLTQTLEEALVDLETSANRSKAEVEAWRKKCKEVEEEASDLRRERGTMRNSIQAVEEERDRRIRAEQAQRQLQERMEALNQNRRKKKQNTLNCF